MVESEWHVDYRAVCQPTDNKAIKGLLLRREKQLTETDSLAPLWSFPLNLRICCPALINYHYFLLFEYFCCLFPHDISQSYGPFTFTCLDPAWVQCLYVRWAHPLSTLLLELNWLRFQESWEELKLDVSRLQSINWPENVINLECLLYKSQTGLF